MNQNRFVEILNKDNCKFHGVSFNTTDRTVHQFSPEALFNELDDRAVFSWIDITGPSIAALNDFLRAFDIHLVLVDFFDKPEILPRIAEHHKCWAFYLYEVSDPERHLDTSQDLLELEVERVLVVLGEDFIITYHQRDLDVVEYVKGNCADNFKFAGKSPGFIAFLFLQRCIYDYAHINLANDNYLDNLEVGVWTGDIRYLLEKVAIAGLNILKIKKLNASMQIVLMNLATKHSPFVTDEGRVSYHELLDNAAAIRQANDASRDLLISVINGLQAKASNRTSEIALVLTVVSSIFLPLSLIAGIFGMNFKNLPGIYSQYGYMYCYGFMGVTTIALLILFHRIGWLWPRKKDNNVI